VKSATSDYMVLPFWHSSRDGTTPDKRSDVNVIERIRNLSVSACLQTLTEAMGQIQTIVTPLLGSGSHQLEATVRRPAIAPQ
jgi:hypothetical protein